MQRSHRRSRRGPPTRVALARIGALGLLILVASVVGYELGWFDYGHTLEHVARLRAAHSVTAFLMGYLVIAGLGMAVGLPGLPFVVAAGALFGTLLGSVLGWTASLIGAMAGYWIARTVAHDVVVRWIKRYRRVNAAVADARDFDGMLWLRLVPVLPIGVVNFIGGVARAPFGWYVAATAIGVTPATIVYAYFADSLVERVGNGRRDALGSLIIASALLMALSLLPRLARRWRNHRSPA